MLPGIYGLNLKSASTCLKDSRCKPDQVEMQYRN